MPHKFLDLESSMFCGSCGSTNSDGAAFCLKCGKSLNVVVQQTANPFSSPPKPTSPGSSFSTVGIICGAIAFLFFPIILGPVGLIFGAVAKSKGEEKAVVALVVSGLGLVVGMFLGFVVFSSL